MVNSAKALLTSEKTKVNTHNSIIADFDEKFVTTGRFSIEGGFSALVLQLNKNKPSEVFAKRYLADAKSFLNQVEQFRKLELTNV
jgi:sulfite reductase (ferredoxin)